MFEQNIYRMVDQNNEKEIKEVLDNENNKVVWERAIPTYDTPVIPTRNAPLLKLTVGGKLVQNGTPTPDNPIYPSCNNGVLKYGVLGKNLFDITAVGIEQGAIASADGGNSNSTYRVRTVGYVPVKPSTQYTLSAVIDGYTSGSSRGVFVLEYSTNAVAGYTGDSSGWKAPNGYTFTTGATTNYIRIVFAAGSNSSTPVMPTDVSNVQLELGDTATDYEPYRAGIYADGTPEVITIGRKNITSYVLDLTVEGDGTGDMVINDLLTGGVPKENTQYTISVDIVSNNVTYSENGNLVYFRVFYSDGTSAYAGVTSQNYTQSKISVTTTAGKTFDRLSLYKHARFTSGTIRLTNLQVEEGTTPTAYEPYKIINIFDKNSPNNGGWYVNNNGNLNEANANATIYFRCQPNTTYYFKHTSVTGGTRAFTTSAETWAAGTPANEMVGTTVSSPNTVRSITTEADAKWIFFIYGRSNQEATFEEQAADFMVSIDPLTASTPYGSYWVPQTASVDNLLSVGDYFDIQDIINGDKNLQIAALVLDGTESGWTYTANRFRLSIPDRLVAKIGLVCTHFEYSDAVSTMMPDKSVIMAGASDLIYFRMDSITTLDGFKDFLANQLSAGKPVILWYVLATAVETQTTPQPLQGYRGMTLIVTAQSQYVSGQNIKVKYLGIDNLLSSVGNAVVGTAEVG